MILDGLLTFTGSAQGATTGGGGIPATSYTDAPTTGTQNCSNILDLGLVGLPTSANGGGARDLGIGDYPSLKLSILATVAFVYSAGGGTTYFQLQGAPDNGSGAPGAWTTLWQSPTFAQATMIQGAQLANVDLPRTIFEEVLPRFLQLVVVTATATYTAGQIEAQIVVDRDDQIIGTSGAMSGYPAGINVAN